MANKTQNKSKKAPQKLLFVLLTRRTRRVSYDEMEARFGVARGHISRPIKAVQELLDEVCPGEYEVRTDTNSDGKREIVLYSRQGRKAFSAHRIASYRLARELVDLLDNSGLSYPSSLLADMPELGPVADIDKMFVDAPFPMRKSEEPVGAGRRTQIIETLCEGIFHQHVVEVAYKKAGAPGPSKRKLRPLSLLTYNGGLYVIAEKLGETGYKTYMVSRMESARILEHEPTRAYPADYHPDQVLDGAFGIFERGRELIDVELVFDDHRHLHQYLRERRWHHKEKFTTLDDGRLQMTFQVSSMTPVWAWIRSFGDSVEMVRPKRAVPRVWGEG